MFESKLNRGRANGYAPLDSEGKVPMDKTYVGANGTSGTSGLNGSQGINGTAGTSGLSGNGFNWQGAWDPSGSYIGGTDVVSYEGGSYIKISGDGNSGSAPPDDPVRWDTFVESGIQGTSGESGTHGTSGTSGTSILLDSNLSFTNNTIQGNNLNAAGTIISIAQSFDARTDLIGNGVNVINNSESSQVQIGWIVRFYDGTVRTVIGSSIPGGQSYRSIQIDQNVSLDPAYPLTIESPDYLVGDDPFVELKAGTSGWTFGIDGSLTLPNGDVIVDAASNGSSGTSGTSGLDSSLSLKWELQDTAGGNPTGSSYFSACCNSGLSNTGIFRFAYTSKTIPAEGFWNTIASAISSGLTPYLQIVQIGDNNVIGLYEIASVNYSDPGNSGQYNVTTNGVPAIYGNGLWSVGEEYAVSFSLAGASGTSGESGSSGTNGSSGTSGTTGSPGSTGTSGSSGSSGSTGASGSSGTSGTSSNGTSGTSFSSPYSGNLNVTSGQAWVSADANGNTTSSTTVNWNDSNIQTFTLNTATTTFAFSNGQAGATYILIIRQNASGSQVITWPAAVAWAGAATPTMTPTASRYDVFTFVFDGSKYFGSYIQNFI